MPASSACSATVRLPGGIICRNTHSLRSIEYPLTLCSHPPAAYTLDKFTTHDNYPDAAGTHPQNLLTNQNRKDVP